MAIFQVTKRRAQVLFIFAGLALSGVAQAAEPVRQIGIYVEPYYRSARAPGEARQVAVGKAYDALLTSGKREDIIAAHNLVAARPGVVTPMVMMVLAIRLYDVGERDDAAFWFYVAKDRAIVLTEVVEANNRAIAPAIEAVKAFSALAGPVINGYAFCDFDKQKTIRAKALDWTQANPYEAMFLPQLPARGPDRRALAAQAVALLRANTAMESAYLAEPKNRDAFQATRKQNDVDAKYCWR